MKKHPQREVVGNPLGSARAESDSAMLKRAFVKTPFYDQVASLAFSSVVGRRGAGKSALFLQLKEDLLQKGHIVLAAAPNASAFHGLVGAVKRTLADECSYWSVRECMRHAWMAAFCGQVCRALHLPGLPAWVEPAAIDSAISLLETVGPLPFHNAAYACGKIAQEMEERLREALAESNAQQVVFLLDGLDEGWIEGDLGDGILGGLFAGAADLRDHDLGVRFVVFLRDNMYRIIQDKDRDSSRIFTSEVLRLDWDDVTLLELVAQRLRVAFNIDSEKPLDVWNRFAKNELSGKDGWRDVLSRTLYRPRDVLELLNGAIQVAQRSRRTEIVASDLGESGQSISARRLADLEKEYNSVYPYLGAIFRAFDSAPAAASVQDVLLRLREIHGPASTEASKLGTTLLQALYCIGFLGFEVTAGSYKFIYDGTDLAPDLDKNARVVVHPCFHRALTIVWPSGVPLDILCDVADEYGEQSPTEKSGNQELLSRLERTRATDLRKRLGNIERGVRQAAEFEEWVRDVLCFAFPTDLSNVEIKPDPSGVKRRDIIATNEAKVAVWQRILQAYKASQVVFEVKNYDQLEPSDYNQVVAYLGREFGSIGFIAYRGARLQGLTPNERSHLQSENSYGRTIVLLPEDFLLRLLGSESNARTRLSKWLDKHTRQFSQPRAGQRA
ncbi:MAG TPA: hypothetical protein VLC09_01240 [Polyangiaceae bacterium]|nr:hypothetical protein [Polyangiaceae bacterium]